LSLSLFFGPLSLFFGPLSLFFGPSLMKLILAIAALLVFALSFVADYKWRQWIKSRRSNPDSGQASRPGPPHQSP
jgi:hypothetical protein